jgi:hypothetical protein
MSIFRLVWMIGKFLFIYSLSVCALCRVEKKGNGELTGRKTKQDAPRRRDLPAACRPSYYCAARGEGAAGEE